MNLSRPRQHEIAERLNIARTTVTKVLNHDPVYRVAPETRALILKTAKEMGYTPRRRRSHNIALVVAEDMLLGYHTLHLQAIKEAATLNKRLFLVHTMPHPSYGELKYYVNPLAADGVLLLGDYSAPVIQRFADLMPVVYIDERPCEVEVDRVYCNFASMSETMAKYAIDRGHTRIATIVDTLTTRTGKDNVNGVTAALEKAGIKPDPTLVWEKRVNNPPKIIKEILDHPAKPTVIIAMAIEEHLTFLSLLESMGANVPEHISYIAWDECGFRSMSHYPDTTRLAGHLEGLAKTAIRRLLKRIDDRKIKPEAIQSLWRMHEGGTCEKLYEPADNILGLDLRSGKAQNEAI